MDDGRELRVLGAAIAAQGIEAYCLVEDGVTVRASAAFAEAFGLSEDEGATWLSALHEPDLSRVRAALACIPESGLALDFDAPGADGGWRRTAARAFRLAGSRTQRAVLAIVDDDAQSQAFARLDALARCDALTGLASRGWLLQACRALIDDCERAGGYAWLLLADVDGLAALNATGGRSAGDQALLRVARCMAGAVRDGDVLARAGGDQFGIALVTADAPADAGVIAARLIRSVSESGPRALAPPVGLSIGIAGWPAHGRNVNGLFRAAAHAMRRAKRLGRHRYCLADEMQPGDAIARLPLLEWGEDRCVGVASMDADHRQIAMLINALGEALSQDRDEERLGACMDALVSFTTTHFAWEEAWMDERGYAQAAAHKAEHTQLLEDVAALAAHLDTRSVALTMSYLGEWLSRHVAGADRELARALGAAR